MNPFQRRPLGQTSLYLTMLGFGSSSVGNLFLPVAEEDVSGAVAAAYGAGIRYFDTAPLYGNGLGERRMGRDLRRYPRDDFVLSTKVGRRLEPLDPGSADIVVLDCQSATAAIQELAASFDGEIAPLLVQVEGQTLKLEGTAEDQFAEWRRLLAELFRAETGLPVDPNEVEPLDPNAAFN